MSTVPQQSRLYYVCLILLICGSTVSAIKPTLLRPLVKVDEMPIPKEHWHCGSNGFSKDISFESVELSCPSLAVKMNHCCAIHDDCYGQQKGQEYCDQEFCECNRLAVRLPIDENINCRSYADSACFILDLMGNWAYQGSNYTEDSDDALAVKLSPQINSLNEKYQELYSSCPFVNITMSSCAFNYDFCIKTHNMELCAMELCNCIMDASEHDKIHPSCHTVASQTCTMVLDNVHEVRQYKSAMMSKYLLIVIFFLLSFTVAGGLAAYRYRLIKRSRRKVDEKHCHMQTVDSSRSIMPLLIEQ